MTLLARRDLSAIALIVFVDLLGLSTILPLLPYYATTFAASPEVIGCLVASYSICQFLTRLLSWAVA